MAWAFLFARFRERVDSGGDVAFELFHGFADLLQRAFLGFFVLQLGEDNVADCFGKKFGLIGF